MLGRRQFLGLGAAGAATLALGCKGGGSDITAGSKNFQEQWILASLIEQLIERDTERSARTKDLAGTFLCHQALTSGGIDTYVEYTGTAFTAVLEEEPIADVNRVHATVREQYRERFDVLVLPPLGFENTFAICVRAADAAEHGLVAISDLARVDDRFRPGFGFEFYERADGYRGLVGAYDLEFGRLPKQMKLSQTYRALAAGEVDVIAGNSTDGLIDALGLTVLRDDRGYFPPYQAVPLLRAATAERYPAVRAALESLAGRIDTHVIRTANYQVDHHQRPPREVAAELLKSIT